MERKLIVRSRNKSCKPLRDINVPYSVILRLGSTTATKDILRSRKPNSKIRLLEINKAEACRISGDKILMKTRFKRGKIPTAEWVVANYKVSINIEKYLEAWKTIIIKHKNSSKGNGIYLIKNIDDYLKFLKEKEFDLNTYIFERYYTYSKEYRIHVTKDGCFYANRKMLKNDAKIRWHRHDTNSVWIFEDNPLFDKPDNWDMIVNSCVDALKSVGLDIAAFDVKVQAKNKINPKWIILESNSAPSLGEVSLIKYKEQITKMIYG